MNETPRPDGTAPETAPMQLHLDGDTASLGPARDAVTEWMTGLGATDDDIQRAVLLTSELVSNAIEASPNRRCELRLSTRPGRRVGIGVTNHQPVTEVPAADQWGPDDVLATKGRGLAIVEALSDAVSVRTVAHDAVTVEATLTLS